MVSIAGNALVSGLSTTIQIQQYYQKREDKGNADYI